MTPCINECTFVGTRPFAHWRNIKFRIPHRIKRRRHQCQRLRGIFGLQGASRSIFQSFPSRWYRKRSCRRLAPPCQNSTESKLTRNPPQKLGSGTSPCWNFCFSSRNLLSSTPRAEMRDYCCDTQAPIWLSFGRLAKYFITSKVESRSALPRKITWRSSMCHGNSRLICGLFANCCALRLPRLV